MKKLLFGVLALVGMRVYADEITVHNTVGAPVTIVTARWHLTSQPSFVLDQGSQRMINAGTSVTFTRPEFKFGRESWLIAALNAEILVNLETESKGIANITSFGERRSSDATLKAKVEQSGINIRFGTNFYIVLDENNTIRIQKDKPGKKGLSERFADTTREMITGVKEGVANVTEAITGAVATRKEEVRGYKDALVESDDQDRILIINGHLAPRYARMYEYIREHNEVKLRAVGGELPVKIEANKYSFLQGPAAGSWWRSSAELILFISVNVKALADSLDATVLPENTEKYSVYHNEILNIAPNSVERFTIGRSIQVYNPEKTKASDAYGAIYVKNKGGGYILASPIIELKATPGFTHPNILFAPDEQGFLARLGFGREKIIVGGAQDTFKARLTNESLAQTPDANLPLKGTAYAVRYDPKLGLIVSTESAYRNRLAKVETWSLWIKNIFRKKATEKLLEELQEQ